MRSADRSPGFDAVFLSPHLDDAALSCGGQIADRVLRGGRVLIVTVFAGDEPAGEPGLSRSPLVDKIQRSWRLGEGAMARRRAEDVTACRILGADWDHWSFCDAIYRREPADGRPLYESIAKLMGEPHSADERLVQQIADRAAAFSSMEALYAPLAVGSHVDHLLTRRAAERAFKTERLIYYEEYPYSRRSQAVERALDAGDSGAAWRSQDVLVSRSAFRKKLAAVDAYRSQLRSLFKGRLLARLFLWWRSIEGSERVWYRTPALADRVGSRGPHQ